MLEPSVKPKIYLVSISRNALSSYACPYRAFDSVSAAARLAAAHQRAGRCARQEIRIALPRSAGFKAPRSKRAGSAPERSDMSCADLRCQANKQMLERFQPANIRTILIRYALWNSPNLADAAASPFTRRAATRRFRAAPPRPRPWDAPPHRRAPSRAAGGAARGST